MSLPGSPAGDHRCRFVHRAAQTFTALLTKIPAPIASFDGALFQLDAASNASSDSDVSSAARRSHGRRFA
ncbi:MAG: hypothetical protein ACJA0V_003175, partial [Planctomycetota bacterium]